MLLKSIKRKELVTMKKIILAVIALSVALILMGVLKSYHN